MARRGGTTPGAAKRGPALLAGLLRCGRCGRKLFVAYSGRGGRVPRYACAGSRTGQGPTSCLSLGGVTIEQAVTDQVLEALQPVGIEASLAAVDQLADTHTEQRRVLELALEKARYQAQRAERQYHTVDPDNRLVAGELEVRWNDALVRVGQLEAIDMDSYRVEKRAVQQILLADENAAIEPVPPTGGGRVPEPELERLSTILREFNDLFGAIQWNDADRVTQMITETIPSRVAQDAAFRNARQNSDEENARIEHANALKRVMAGLIKDDSQLFKQFADNPGFKRWMTDTIFPLASEQTR